MVTLTTKKCNEIINLLKEAANQVQVNLLDFELAARLNIKACELEIKVKDSIVLDSITIDEHPERISEEEFEKLMEKVPEKFTKQMRSFKNE